QMLAKAQPHARAGLRFEQADLAAVEGAWDLVFSHAAIQWVDDHAALIPRLWQLVAPGGQMAIQQPANHDHLSHVFARELAAEEPFRTALNGWVRIPPVMPMDRYAQMLFDLGAEDMTVLEKIYPHVLENADAIAEWTSGTLLVPYFERLGDLRDNFMVAYRARLREAFPGSPVFYPFRRMLFTAHRPH
ncbi:MAG: trans-aconitate methyltransferase, partial [Anaerolineae bacterium]|nr:trans-aconitate methyltransferase [Anaerolineae bacterium]